MKDISTTLRVTPSRLNEMQILKCPLGNILLRDDIQQAEFKKSTCNIK